VIEKKRIEEADSNVRQYITDGLLKDCLVESSKRESKPIPAHVIESQVRTVS
jgi:hypothetical protein